MTPALAALALLCAAAAPPAAPPNDDHMPPALTHLPVLEAEAGKPVTIEARITDPSGVFQPVVYVRQKGATQFTAVPMEPRGEGYAAEVPATLVTADLEYFVEAYDTLGNGPGRAGAPEAPFSLKLKAAAPASAEGETPPIAPPPVVVSPPTVVHFPLGGAQTGKPVTIEARFLAPGGISLPVVYFRPTGARSYAALAMTDSGEGKYGAEIPGALVHADFDYYVEAHDARGGPPGRAASPEAPFHVSLRAEGTEAAPAPPPAAALMPSEVEATPEEPAPVVIRRVEPAALEQVPSLTKKKGTEPNGYKFFAWLGYGAAAASVLVAATNFADSERAYGMYKQRYEREGVIDRDALARADTSGVRAVWFVSGAAAGIVLGTAFVIIAGSAP